MFTGFSASEMELQQWQRSLFRLGRANFRTALRSSIYRHSDKWLTKRYPERYRSKSMMEIRVAQTSDAEAIARVINDAFRVAESFFITRDRTSPEKVRDMLDRGKFLLARDAAGIAGCVYVELRGERGYFGLLAVDPARQRRGLGRELIDAAEEYVRGAGCGFMDIRIVNLRNELPPFYRSLGYFETGAEPSRRAKPRGSRAILS